MNAIYYLIGGIIGQGVPFIAIAIVIIRSLPAKQKRELPDTSHLQLTPNGVIKTIKHVKEIA